jgi:hypothetical protein
VLSNSAYFKHVWGELTSEMIILDSTSATPGALNKGDEGLPLEAARNFQILAQLPFGCWMDMYNFHNLDLL